jgi:hypothetical protein
MRKNHGRVFYVYAYLRSKDSEHGKRLTPYYIGKGKDKRAYSSYKRSALPPKDKGFIVFIQEGLTEQEALSLEKFCISVYGRIDNGTGILRNLTDGGDGLSGFIIPEETKRKISVANKGKTLGRKLSDETKRKISNAMAGKNNPRWNKPVSAETRTKMSQAKDGFKPSQEAIKKMVIANARYLYEITDPNGEIYATENLADFARQYGLTIQHLRNTITGRQRQHKGWKARIIETLR